MLRCVLWKKKTKRNRRIYDVGSVMQLCLHGNVTAAGTSAGERLKVTPPPAGGWKRGGETQRGEAKGEARKWRKATCVGGPEVGKEQKRGTGRGGGVGGRGGEGGVVTRAPSDRQRDETVILLDVAFEDVRTRAQDALEARPVQLDALQGAAGDHGGGAGAVHQQSDLTCAKSANQHEVNADNTKCILMTLQKMLSLLLNNVK